MTSHEQRVRALAPLEPLVGMWSGTGWAATASGRVEFDQTERVTYVSGGELLTIEGTGTAPDNPEDVRFRAFAVMRFDDVTGELRWWANSEGHELDVPLEIHDDGFAWQFSPHEGAIVRYTLAVDDTTWSEAGYMSRDNGRTWEPTLVMSLSSIC